MREKIIKSPIPAYAVGIIWIVYSCVFPMYQWYHFLILTSISIFIFVVLNRLIKPKKIMIQVPYEPIKTGIGDVDKLIADGNEYLKKIKEINKSISSNNVELSTKITKLENSMERIFAYISKNPEKAPRIRKFLSYYMPTLLKLLTTYSFMQLQTVKGENITLTMLNIEEIIDTLIPAFEKQLDNLYEDEALDISADITVLEGMLAKEGLTDDYNMNMGDKK